MRHGIAIIWLTKWTDQEDLLGAVGDLGCVSHVNTPIKGRETILSQCWRQGPWSGCRTSQVSSKVTSEQVEMRMTLISMRLSLGKFHAVSRRERMNSWTELFQLMSSVWLLWCFAIGECSGSIEPQFHEQLFVEFVLILRMEVLVT
jgi:hypothetical protein